MQTHKLILGPITVALMLTAIGCDEQENKRLAEMAERRPQSLDEMAGITGIGAKKLDLYGRAFLSVILGAPPPGLHPARMALAGRPEGDLFDRLAEAQVRLARGVDGTEKPLSCTHTTLRKIAETKPRTLDELARIQGMGDLKVDRFGAAFLEAIARVDD